MTIVELLMVVLLAGIIASMVVTRFDPAVADQLDAAAQILVADLDYARGLAIAHNSRYSLFFDQTNHRYYVQHTGTNPALHALPKSPFLVDGVDGTNKPLQEARWSRVLGFGPSVQMSLTRRSVTRTSISSVEFTPLGNTTGTESAEIWLSCGSGADTRYISVQVDSVTGLATAGALTTAIP